VIGDISHHLDQRHADIRHVTLLPPGHGDRHAIEEQLPEAGVVLGKIVDVRQGRRRLHARRGHCAVDILRTIEAEADRRAGITRIESGIRPPTGRLIAR